MLNLYKLYSDPKSLDHYRPARAQVPTVAWSLARTPKRRQDLEHLWAQSANTAYKYANIVLLPRWQQDHPYKPFPGWPAGEPAIAQNAELSYNYALRILRGPFPAGEPAIAQDYWYALEYAMHVLEGPFPAGEPAILRSDNNPDVYVYARYVLYPAWRRENPGKGFPGWPAGEAVLARQGGKYADWYARRVLKLRGERAKNWTQEKRKELGLA